MTVIDAFMRHAQREARNHAQKQSGSNFEAMICGEGKSQLESCIEPKAAKPKPVVAAEPEPKNNGFVTGGAEPKSNNFGTGGAEPNTKAQPQDDVAQDVLAAMNDAMMRFSSMNTLLKLGQGG